MIEKSGPGKIHEVILVTTLKPFNKLSNHHCPASNASVLFLFSCVTFFRFVCDVNKKKLALCHMLPYWSTVSHL